jgi:hypothetical protein
MIEKYGGAATSGLPNDTKKNGGFRRRFSKVR